MFNVTIIKLKDLIKIGIILILVYIFSNYIIKGFKTKCLADLSFEYDSIYFIEAGIEKQSNIIKSISKFENNTNDKISGVIPSFNNIFDIKSIINIGSNMFYLSGQKNQVLGSTDISKTEEEEKNNRYR